MAKRVVEEVTDDLDGSKAAETVTFGLDGINYEIDLNSRHADQLRKALARFVDGARRTGGRRRRGTPGAVSVNPSDSSVEVQVAVPTNGAGEPNGLAEAAKEIQKANGTNATRLAPVVEAAAAARKSRKKAAAPAFQEPEPKPAKKAAPKKAMAKKPAKETAVPALAMTAELRATIRAWGREQGRTVSDRGALSPALVQAYQESLVNA